jgi:hypothetical protein
MPNRSSKPETDPNRLAFMAVQKGIEATEGQPAKDPLAVELGRRGGLKGGKARAERLSPSKRKAIARRAARARWRKAKS